MSRHVTIHDVAPSLPGRVTHLRVTLSPPTGEQDTIRRTSVVVPSGSLGKQGQVVRAYGDLEPEGNAMDPTITVICTAFFIWIGLGRSDTRAVRDWQFPVNGK